MRLRESLSHKYISRTTPAGRKSYDFWRWPAERDEVNLPQSKRAVFCSQTMTSENAQGNSMSQQVGANPAGMKKRWGRIHAGWWMWLIRAELPGSRSPALSSHFLCNPTNRAAVKLRPPGRTVVPALDAFFQQLIYFCNVTRLWKRG